MITMTCICGKSAVTFQNLSEKDFPNGFENECCTQVIVEAVAEVVAEVPEDEEPALDLEDEVVRNEISTKVADRMLNTKHKKGKRK